MNETTATLRFGVKQELLKVTIATDAADESVSNHYLFSRLPTSLGTPKQAWLVESNTPAELETLYDDDLPQIDLQVKVTSGATPYAVRITAVYGEETFETQGQTNLTLSLTIPLPEHPNADADPHNSTLAPDDGTQETITAGDVGTLPMEIVNSATDAVSPASAPSVDPATAAAIAAAAQVTPAV